MTSRILKALRLSNKHSYMRKTYSSFDCNYFSLVNGAEVYPGPQAKLKGRPFLPGSKAESFPDVLNGPREDFPLIFQLQKTSFLKPAELAVICRQKLDEFLPIYHAVLFRGLNFKSAIEFNEFYDYCGYEKFNYVGGSGLREKLSSHIYNASNEPNNYNIELHNELSDTPICNQKIMLYCLIASPTGGLSPICRNIDIIKELDSKYIEKIRETGITYYRTNVDDMTEGAYSWQNTFETSSRKVAEEEMDARAIKWKWLENGKLRFWYKLNAFTQHPDTGDEVWFNQITARHCSHFQSHPFYENLNCPGLEFPIHCSYGNGDEFEPEFLQSVREAGWRNAVGFPWQHGDLMFIDNIAVKHSRLSFTGERKILLGLFEPLKLYGPDLTNDNSQQYA